MDEEGFSSMNYTRANDGRARFDGITASLPKTKLKGEAPIEALRVI